MTRSRKPIVPRGLLRMVIGAALASPALYNAKALDNGVGAVIVGLGVLLFLQGLARLLDVRAVRPKEGAAGAAGEDAKAPAEAGNASTSAYVFRMLGHLTVILTLAGGAYTIFVARPGGSSGVGIALGLLVAGAFYLLAASSKS